MDIGQRIKEAREGRQASLQRVAEAAGIAISTLWLIEKGRARNPRFHTIERICKQLDIPIEEAAG